MSIHKGQGGIFLPEIACLCYKADLRLYSPRQAENSLLCVFSVIPAIKINYYTILVHCLKKMFDKYKMYKTHESKGAELICHLSRFICDLHERGRHNRVALAIDMDASETPTHKKWVLSQRGKYINLPDKLRKQSKPNTRYSPYIFSLDFICGVDMAKILLLSVGQAICEPINFDWWMLVRMDQKILYLKMMYWVTHDSLRWCLKP